MLDDEGLVVLEDKGLVVLEDKGLGENSTDRPSKPDVPKPPVLEIASVICLFFHHRQRERKKDITYSSMPVDCFQKVSIPTGCFRLACLLC